MRIRGRKVGRGRSKMRRKIGVGRYKIKRKIRSQDVKEDPDRLCQGGGVQRSSSKMSFENSGSYEIIVFISTPPFLLDIILIVLLLARSLSVFHFFYSFVYILFISFIYLLFFLILFFLLSYSRSFLYFPSHFFPTFHIPMTPPPSPLFLF